MPGKIQLVLPGLFDIPAADCSSQLLERGLPRLNHFLRYASSLPNRAFSIDAILHDILLSGEQGVAADGLALAQAVAGDESLPATRLLLFKAVHLRPGLHNALIVPIEETEKNLEDILLIIKDLSHLFKVDCDIKEALQGLYLMRLENIEAPRFYPHFLSVLGKPANPYILQTREHLSWYRLLNEMQMFMHQHEVNQQRMARGEPAINSLWCWGAGELPRAARLPQAWYCDDVLLQRYAASLGIDVQPLREIGAAPAGADCIVVDLRLLECLKTGSAHSLDALLQEIDGNLLQPLLQRIGRGRLRLRAGHEFDYEIGANSRLRFWRKASNLARYLNAAEPA